MKLLEIKPVKSILGPPFKKLDPPSPLLGPHLQKLGPPFWL